MKRSEIVVGGVYSGRSGEHRTVQGFGHYHGWEHAVFWWTPAGRMRVTRTIDAFAKWARTRLDDGEDEVQTDA